MSADLWHRPLTQIRSGELRGDTGQTSGMTRWEGISGKSTGAEKHREENLGTDEAVVIIARSSQEGIVVNLDSLWPDRK